MILHLALITLLAMQPEKVRVACVGDSITFGACVKDRKTNCYPAVLGRLLGDGYDVRNFGVNGATLLKKGNKPYWKLGAFKNATEFKPNVVVIKLGTNDTKANNWKHKAEFEADYRELVRHFKNLPSRPKVWVALPVPVIRSSFGIKQEPLLEQLPILRKVAREEDAGIIDLFSKVTDAKLFDKDGIHPNAAGAKRIAEIVHEALSKK